MKRSDSNRYGRTTQHKSTETSKVSPFAKVTDEWTGRTLSRNLLERLGILKSTRLSEFGKKDG